VSTPEVKEWVKVATDAAGVTQVSVSLTQGNLSAKWAMKAFSVSLKTDVKRARTQARRHLSTLRQAIDELDAEEGS
jgi:hypothetical protein